MASRVDPPLPPPTWQEKIKGSWDVRNRPIRIPPDGKEAPHIVFSCGNPSMLSTSYEARKVALETATTRPYDPSADMLYSPRSKPRTPLAEAVAYKLNRTEIETVFGYEWEVWRLVKHLGIAPPDEHDLDVLEPVVSWLDGAGSPSIVYSTPPGVPLSNTATEKKKEGGESLPAWRGASSRLICGISKEKCMGEVQGDKEIVDEREIAG